MSRVCAGGIEANTESVAAAERFDFWHDVICAAFVRLEAETLPSERPFSAEIASRNLGPLTLSRVRAEPHAVQRSIRLINQEPRDDVLVSVQLSGTAAVRQDDRQAILKPGDFALYDATRPYNLIMREHFEMLVLQFDRRFLMERCPSPEHLTALRIAGDNPEAAAVSGYLRSLRSVALEPDDFVSRQLATSALDLLGAALAGRFGADGSPNSKRTMYFLRACNYINVHASDPTLTLTQVAAAVGVSLRYLHAVFSDHDISVGEYLIKRRLSRCLEELLSPPSATKTITEIALKHGFKSAAHFTRRFSEAYGRCPSDVRRNGLAGSDS